MNILSSFPFIYIHHLIFVFSEWQWVLPFTLSFTVQGVRNSYSELILNFICDLDFPSNGSPNPTDFHVLWLPAGSVRRALCGATPARRREPRLTPSAASMNRTTPSEMRKPAVTSSEKFTCPAKQISTQSPTRSPFAFARWQQLAGGLRRMQGRLLFGKFQDIKRRKFLPRRA